MHTYIPTGNASDFPIHADTQATVLGELEDNFYWHRIRRLSKKG